MNTKWIKAVGIRAIKTVAQTAVSLMTVGQAVTDMDWQKILSISVGAGVMSILTSVATGLPELKEKTYE